MARIAILVSAKIDRQEARSGGDEQPRKDYFELARALDATIIYDEKVVSRMWKNGGRTALGPSFVQAWHAFQRRDDYDCILTDSEHVGIPLALLFKLFRVRKCHVMIAHRLTPTKKAIFFRQLKVHSHIDKLVCYGSTQRDFITSELSVPAEKVELVLHPADHRFWRPLELPKERLIASAGLTFRDYPTLIDAIRSLDLQVMIAAASPWWTQDRNETRGRSLPPNVSVVSHSPAQLRELYARSLFVVVPLREVDSQAGSLVMYEAMAAGKAVIASRTRGQGDILEDGVTGLYVPPANIAALRGAILQLLENPHQAEEMGRNARRVVEMGLNLDTYVANLARVVTQASEAALAASRPTLVQSASGEDGR